MSEEPQPGAAPGIPAGPDAGHDITSASTPRLTETVVGHLTDQARRTASAARAGRVATNADGEPGVLDLTPLRELLAEIVDEARQLRLRDRIARALRQMADIIDPQTPAR